MLKRQIEFYRKDNEEFAGEIPLNIDVDVLQKKYNNVEYDPMVIYIYPITPDDESFFSRFLDNYKFDFANFDYFLGCFEV